MSLLKIVLSMLPMISRKVDLSFEKLGQGRRKWTDVSISLPQLQIGLSETWKLCLNLWSRKWPKRNLSLVNNLTPLGLWQLKTMIPEGCIKFKSFYLKIFKLSELRIFRSSLFHSITAEEKKEFWKKLWFTLNRRILLVFLVLYVLTELGMILNSYFGYLYLKLLKNNTVSYTIFFLQRFSSYSFSLDVPLIAPIIANTVL